MITVLNNDVKDPFKDITGTCNTKSKNVKTKNNAFNEVLKKSVSNSDSVKQNKFSKGKEKIELKDTGFNEEELNCIAQMLGINNIEVKEIIDKLSLDDISLNIDSPKIDLYIIIKENLEGILDEPSLKLLNSLKENMSFDALSFEDYKNSSKKDILDIMKFIANFKNDSLQINKQGSLNSVNKFIVSSESNVVSNNDFNIIQKNTNYVKEEFKNVNPKETLINEETFLKSLIKSDSNVKTGIDDTKVNITIDKFSDMSNRNLSNDLTTKELTTTLNIRKDNFDYGIVKSMKFMSLSNMKELTLRVVPRELGEIIIRVTLENSVLKANLKPTTKEGYELLQNNLNSIKEKLANSSIKIQEFSVDIYDNNSTAGNDKNFKENNPYENSRGKSYGNTDGEDEIAKLDVTDTDTINDMVNILA